MNSSNTAPRYDIVRNPPYQINFRAKRAGKRISASKRHVTFRFGFSSADAIARGLLEKDCRGEEHEVVLVWSHVTGKRRLFLDAREVHASKAARGNTKFEHSWSAFGTSTLKVVAHCAPSTQNGGERQFDLELDGLSFFEFSKIYQLGQCAEGRAIEPSYSYRGLAYDDRSDEEEKDDLPTVSENRADLLDLPTCPDLSSSPSFSFCSVPSLTGCSTSFDSAGSYDEFAPVDSAARTYDVVSNEILHAYGKTSDFSESSSSGSRALVPFDKESADQNSRIFARLVNLDDITTSAEPVKPNSPTLDAMKEGRAGWGPVGRAPTLSEMRNSFAHSPGAMDGSSMHASRWQ